jgi:GTP-binding protein HflX
MIERKSSQNQGPEKAILVGAITPTQIEEKIVEYLDELEFLATTAGATTMARFTQKLATPNPKTFVGSGKLDEIIHYIKEEKIDVVCFHADRPPAQRKTIARAVE